MWLKGLYMRVRALLRSETIHEEIDEEMRFHIDMRAEENVRRGMAPGEARREAEQRFGGLTRMKERGYEVRGGRWLEALWRDCRYGARSLRKSPGFTVAAVMTLALGVGANTAVFSVVNAVLLRPLPYEHPGRLVRLWADNSGRRTDQNQFSPAQITEFRDQLNTFEDVGLFDYGLSANLTGGGRPERVNGSEASPGLFTTLGVKPVLGRTFLPDETEVAQSRVALISEGLWRRRFGADPNLVGRAVQLDGESFTVIGVLPGSFKFPEQVDVWLPFSFTAGDWQTDHAHYYVEAVGRLKPGVTLEQARAELEAIVGRLRPTFPAARKNWGVALVPLHEQVVGGVSSTLWILFGAVGLVLLIACVNVANLLLARAASRQKEVTIRAALGAGRLRIVRQLLTESLLLAVAGGAAGALMAVWAVRLLSASVLDSLPRGEEVSVDGRVLIFTLLISVATGVAFGVMPAVQVSNPNLNETLKEGGRRSTVSRGGLRNVLVVAEIALSLVLLAGAGLLIKSFILLQGVDAGFDPRNLLTMQVTLPKMQYPDTDRQNAFVRQTLRGAESLPGVKSAAATINLPLAGTWGMGYTVMGHDNAPLQVADNAIITPDYFRTMGIPILKGRDFSDSDTGDGPKVIIISEALARKHFPNENPLGQRINAGVEREVVGVVGDVKPRGLELEVKPQIYLPYAQKPTPAPFVTFTVRTESAPLGLAGAVENEIRNLNKDLPVANVRTMEQIVAASLKQRRVTMLLLGVFAGIAVLLASVGVYGVIAYSVTRRTHELGIRMALGAQPRDVLRLVIWRGLGLVLAGVALGVAGALVLTRVMSSLLYSVGAADPQTLAATALLLTAVSLVACYIPARRATRVNPLTALRCD